MKLASLELLWPYPPGSPRKAEQLDVVAELEDGSRWACAFRDTQRFNRGTKGFHGLGADQPYRIGPQIVIVRELTEASIRSAIESMLAEEEFQEAFERIEAPQD